MNPIARTNSYFTSKFFLTEEYYRTETLYFINNKELNLFELSIPGVTLKNYRNNTGKEFNAKMFYTNFEMLMKCKVPFYITFYNPDRQHVSSFKEHLSALFGKDVINDAYIIDEKARKEQNNE